MSAKPGRPRTKTKPRVEENASPLSRESILADFRKIAGPLRGQNRDRSPKS